MRSLLRSTPWLIAPAWLLVSCDSKPAVSNTEAEEQPVQLSLASDSGTDLSAPNTPTGFTSQFQETLAKVNAQCPQEYPEVVTPIPDDHEWKSMETEKLLGMLESWNPVLRMDAAKALGARGKEVIPQLREGTRSNDGKVRAGSATALAAIANSLPSEELPPDLAEDFIRLSTDDEHEVRVAALTALGTLTPKTKETTLAVLAMCNDPNEYLAQDAKIALDKSFELHKLPIEDIETGLRAAMGGPLPRGKGHIVNIIAKLKPEDQRRFITELLAHLDWYADRDTMFAGGGQELALKLLTKLEVEELVPRLPKLMGKSGRGMHLYAPSIASARALGAKSTPIYDELKAIYNDLKKLGKEAPITPDHRSDFKEGMNDLKRLIIELEAY